MHEFGIAQTLLDEVIAAAKAHGARPVERIHVRVGRGQHLTRESLANAFRAVAKETLAADAELDYEDVPVRVRCAACGKSSEADDLVGTCPSCGAAGIEMVSGRELILESVTLKEGN